MKSVDKNTTLGGEKLVSSKQSSTNSITNMKTAKMIRIQLQSEHLSGWTDDDVKKYEMDIVNYFK